MMSALTQVPLTIRVASWGLIKLQAHSSTVRTADSSVAQQQQSKAKCMGC